MVGITYWSTCIRIVSATFLREGNWGSSVGSTSIDSESEVSVSQTTAGFGPYDVGIKAVEQPTTKGYLEFFEACYNYLRRFLTW